jgi:tetratricopeptide (TPR) repeat protein
MIRKGVLGILLLLSVLSVVGQNPFKGSSKSIFWDAEDYYLKGDLLNGLVLFDSIYSEKPNNPKLNFYIGDSYFQLKDYKKALTYLSKAVEINDANYELSYSHLHEGDFTLAAADLKKYTWNEQSKFTKYEAQQLDSNIKTYARLIYEPEVVNIINLGKAINTSADEYVPLISSDESLLLFTSKRDSGAKRDPLGRPYEDIYYSNNDKDGFNWNPAKKVKGKVNSPLHDACVGLSPDGNTMFLFRSNENLIGGDLYESILMDGKWTTPVIMSNKINGTLSIEPSGSISLDGKTFYFSSNRDGGYGGFDLYRAVKFPNGEWSEALNLGPNVNTPLDEDAPFIHPDGRTLYFSSQGHTNVGGFDVFKTELKNKNWANPANLGSPTNTSKDDIYFTISANEKHGYYSSAKEGGFGGQDIYVIDYLEKSLRQSVISAELTVNGIPSSLEISLIDLETGELAGIYRSNPMNGKFIFLVNPNVEYEIIVEGENIEEFSEIINYSVKDLLSKQKKQIKVKGIAE